jgi:monoterpene epsilon-lactone hydrolase
MTEPADFQIDSMDGEGTISVPAFKLPFSSNASPESRDATVEHYLAEKRWKASGPGDTSTTGIEELRIRVDESFTLPLLYKQRLRWQQHVDITATEINGVFADVFTPKDGIPAANQDRVLINVHGGGFLVGARTMGEVESLPIAGLGQMRVLSVDYRMFPEHRFPTATEDLAAFFQGLLTEYDPKKIGIYGSSAGGILAAQSVPWFLEHDIPLPGALGMFAGTGQFRSGDSAILSSHVFNAAYFDTNKEEGMEPEVDMAMPYFEGADVKGPFISPMLWNDVLRKFPPSLLITGTRAHEMSALIDAHNKLTAVGVHSRLHIWDGLGHCFYLDSNLPETREVERIIVSFFEASL